jgi:hypothetical protein
MHGRFGALRGISADQSRGNPFEGKAALAAKASAPSAVGYGEGRFPLLAVRIPNARSLQHACLPR